MDIENGRGPVFFLKHPWVNSEEDVFKPVMHVSDGLDITNVNRLSWVLKKKHTKGKLHHHQAVVEDRKLAFRKGQQGGKRVI